MPEPLKTFTVSRASLVPQNFEGYGSDVVPVVRLFEAEAHEREAVAEARKEGYEAGHDELLSKSIREVANARKEGYLAGHAEAERDERRAIERAVEKAKAETRKETFADVGRAITDLRMEYATAESTDKNKGAYEALLRAHTRIESFRSRPPAQGKDDDYSEDCDCKHCEEVRRERAIKPPEPAPVLPVIEPLDPAIGSLSKCSGNELILSLAIGDNTRKINEIVAELNRRKPQ